MIHKTLHRILKIDTETYNDPQNITQNTKDWYRHTMIHKTLYRILKIDTETYNDPQNTTLNTKDWYRDIQWSTKHYTEY